MQNGIALRSPNDYLASRNLLTCICISSAKVKHLHTIIIPTLLNLHEGFKKFSVIVYKTARISQFSGYRHHFQNSERITG